MRAGRRITVGGAEASQPIARTLQEVGRIGMNSDAARKRRALPLFRRQFYAGESLPAIANGTDASERLQIALVSPEGGGLCLTRRIGEIVGLASAGNRRRSISAHRASLRRRFVSHDGGVVPRRI